MCAAKLSLKNVTYTRGHQASRNFPIVLGGESRWIRDIELLLEDNWKKVICPEDLKALTNEITENPPKICIVEYGAFQGNEMKLLDSNLPKETEKILITNGTTNELEWKRTQRKMASMGVKCLELSSDSTLGAQELSEVLDEICTNRLSMDENLVTIQHAYSGFQLALPTEINSSLTLFKLLASKFSFEPNSIVSGTLLAETYTLWKRPKSTNSTLYMAYLSAEGAVDDEKILKLIELSRECSELFEKTGTLEENGYNDLLAKSGLGRLAIRMLKGSIEEIQHCMAETSKNSRRLRVA